MRHRKNSKRLSRQSAHRKALLRNMAKSILQEQKITTTLALAKESRRMAEKLITLGKQDTLAARRQAYRVLADHDLVKFLFTEISPRFSNRNGGYTRIVRLSNRHGDNAEMAVLELTELVKPEEKKPEKKTARKKAEKKPTAGKTEKASTETAEGQESPEEGQEGSKKFLKGLRKFLKKDEQA